MPSVLFRSDFMETIEICNEILHFCYVVHFRGCTPLMKPLVWMGGRAWLRDDFDAQVKSFFKFGVPRFFSKLEKEFEEVAKDLKNGDVGNMIVILNLFLNVFCDCFSFFIFDDSVTVLFVSLYYAS